MEHTEDIEDKAAFSTDSVAYSPCSEYKSSKSLNSFYMLSLYLQPVATVDRATVLDHVGNQMSSCGGAFQDLKAFTQIALDMSSLTYHRHDISKRLIDTIIAFYDNFDLTACPGNCKDHPYTRFRVTLDYRYDANDIAYVPGLPVHIAQYIDAWTRQVHHYRRYRKDLTQHGSMEYLNQEAVISHLFGQFHAKDPVMLYSLSSFREAFESSHDHMVTPIVHASAAAYWILNYGNIIHRASFNANHDSKEPFDKGGSYLHFIRSSGSDLYKDEGNRVLSPGRWACWKLGFRRLSERATPSRWKKDEHNALLLKDARWLAGKAYQEMVRLEYLSDEYKERMGKDVKEKTEERAPRTRSLQ